MEENQIYLCIGTSDLHNFPDLLLQILVIEPLTGPWLPKIIIFFGYEDMRHDRT